MSIPARLLQTEAKSKRGEYLAAFSALNGVYNPSKAVDRIVRAELLFRLGKLKECSGLLEASLVVTTLSPVLKSRCLGCMGIIARYRHDLPESVALLEQALRHALTSGDISQVARVQLDLLATRAELFGPANLGTLPSETKNSVLRSGDPHLFACLHMRFGEVEMRRGALELAERHFELALESLSHTNNPWIDGNTHTFKTCIALLRHELDHAFSYCDKALEAAQLSGHKMTETAALSNKGYAYMLAGNADEAVNYLLLAKAADSGVGKNWFGITENLAQIALARGDVSEAVRLLDVLETVTATQGVESGSWNQLAAGITRVKLLLRRDQPDEGLRLSTAHAATALARNDRLLSAGFGVLQAECLMALGRQGEAIDALFRACEIDPRTSLSTTLELLRVRTRAAEASNLTHMSEALAARARRIQRGSVPLWNWPSLEADPGVDEALSQPSKCDVTSPHANAACLRGMEAAASLISFGSRPDLLAAETFSVLKDVAVASSVSLIQTRDEKHEIIAAHRAATEVAGATDEIEINCGSFRGDRFYVTANVIRDFVSRSFLEALREIVAAALQLDELRRDHLRRTSVWPRDEDGPPGETLFLSPRMREMRNQALRAARSDLNILITGETGVGKEVVARMIHEASRRSSKRFEPVVCAAVPRDLFEGHLFGHRRGAFTGAITDSLGVIRANEGGTIFLDEIGELSLEEQVKLLRLLDAKEVHPLGSPRAIQVDVRIIAATNADLHELVEQKKFRSDLFHRLNAVPIRVPPLRERRDEIVPLMRLYLERFCSQTDRTPLSISDEACKYLVFYDWPGNIRELKNEMERLAGLVDSDLVLPRDLKSEITLHKSKKPEVGPNECVIRIDQKLENAYNQIARLAIVAALKRNEGNLENAADDLGITRKGLYNMRLRLGML